MLTFVKFGENKYSLVWFTRHAIQRNCQCFQCNHVSVPLCPSLSFGENCANTSSNEASISIYLCVFLLFSSLDSPEKDHSRQLKAFAKLRQNKQFEAVQLVLIGGVRNDEDRARVTALRQQATQLGVEDNVKFVENASLDDLHRYLRQATVGLHTMWNEHFGIGVVEMMVGLLFLFLLLLLWWSRIISFFFLRTFYFILFFPGCRCYCCCS